MNNLLYIYEIHLQGGAVIKNEIELPEYVFEIHLQSGEVIKK